MSRRRTEAGSRKTGAKAGPRKAGRGGVRNEALIGRRPTWAAIDLEAVRANFALATRLAAGRAVIAVVKADAYGHGAACVARALAQAGCRRLAVLTLDEAAALRAAGVELPVLVLGGVHDASEA